MRKIMMIVGVFALTLTAASARVDSGNMGTPGYATSAKAHSAAKKTVAAVIKCPVTGEKIASPSKAAGKSVYKGKTYYFCCPACKPKFDKNPAKYVKNAAKGVYDKM